MSKRPAARPKRTPRRRKASAAGLPPSPPAALPSARVYVNHANSLVALNTFIHDMRDAMTRSRANGGIYPVFLHDADGDCILQLDIQLRVRPCA